MRRDWGHLHCSVWRKGDLNYSLQLRKGSRDGGAELLSLISNDKTWGKDTKPLSGRFRVDIKKYFLTVWVVKHWNNLLREGMDASWLSVFKRYLDNVFAFVSSEAVWHLNLTNTESPFQQSILFYPILLYHSVFYSKVLHIEKNLEKWSCATASWKDV